MNKKTWSTIGKTAAVAALVASIGLNIYTYVSMPGMIADYVSQHRDELKGDKGDKGDQGEMGIRGPMGISGANGSDGAPADNSISCTTLQYGMNGTTTNCY